MASARRLLQTYPGQFQAAEPPDALGADSDVVVILAALLCALLCVVGLAAVTGCARSRRGADGTTRSAASSGPDANKGLKKRALMALPKLAYEDAVAAAVAARGGPAGEEREEILSECAICLSEFAEKEEIRVLPQCGHGFHVACVDAWLRAHSSCPSCRRAVVVAVDAAPPEMLPEPKRCRKCEAMEEASSSASASASAGGHVAARFLP